MWLDRHRSDAVSLLRYPVLALIVISRLDIQNLRSFSGRRSVNLAPITLVYGPNSAGKSTLIQSLCVLKQTFGRVRDANAESAPTLELRGDLVDLGTFETAVYRHETQRRLAIGAQVWRPDGDPLYCGVSFTGDGGVSGTGSRQVGAQIGFGDDIMRFGVTEDGRFTLDTQGQAELAKILNRGTGPNDPASVRRRIELAIGQRSDAAQEVRFDASASRSVLPELPVPRTWLRHAADVDAELTEWWVNHVYEACRTFVSRLEELHYIGPMRSAPSRFQTLATSARSPERTDPTARLLVENAIALGDGDDSPLVERVNSWLERLELGYTLSVSELRGPDGAVQRDVIAITLQDRAGVLVTPQDVGYGVSQLLPIIVQICASRGGTICIEQPEVHIHPKLQTELGDLLIGETRAGRANQVIVETHSEHLLLRVQRRIRERTLDPKDVAVLFVQQDRYGGGAEILELKMDAHGRFTDPWPKGFFDERVQEIFL